MFWTLLTAFAAPPGAFSGTWVHNGDAAEIAKRDQMVEDAAQTFNFAIRGFARPKLKKIALLDASIAIRGDDAKVTFDFTGENTRSSTGPTDGSTFVLRGANVRIDHVPEKSLTFHGSTDEGGKVSTYTLVGPNTMRADYVVTSNMLSGPLKWSFTYRRK